MAQRCRPMRGDATRAVHGVGGEPCVPLRAYAIQSRHITLLLQNAQFCNTTSMKGKCTSATPPIVLLDIAYHIPFMLWRGGKMAAPAVEVRTTSARRARIPGS